MGLAKKIGIIILVYVIIGIVWSAMMYFGIIPEPGGFEGPLNLLYVIFQPVTLIFVIFMVALGIYPQ